MAQRRMFSNKIIDTDLFLDMPVSARELYFQFGMRADDDGFVSSPKKIIKMIGSSDDDLKILISKQFLFPFSNGVCVITDWKIHNYIQSDRYQPTQYLNEKRQLCQDDNGKYKIVDTKCIQDVSTMDTQVRLGKSKVRLELGKVRKGKVKKIDTKVSTGIPEKKEYGNENLNLIIQKAQELNFALQGTKTYNRRMAWNLYKKFGLEKTLKSIEYAAAIRGQPYAPVINDFGQLYKKIGDLICFYDKENNNKPRIGVVS